MPLKQIYENNASSYIAQAVGGNLSDNHIFIIENDASKFPSPISGEEFFLATLENVQTKQWEIVRVNQRVGNHFTVTRNQEGSGIKSFPIGSKIQVRVTKGTLERLYNRSTDISNYVHDQQTPSDTWLVNHNLNRTPVTHIEIGMWVGSVFTKIANAEAIVNYNSSNTLTVTFSESVSGRIICS